MFRFLSLKQLRNDLYCVEWGVKLYSLTHSAVVAIATRVTDVTYDNVTNRR